MRDFELLLLEKFDVSFHFFVLRFEKWWESSDLEVFTNFGTVYKPRNAISIFSAIAKCFFVHIIMDENDFLRDGNICLKFTFLIAREQEFTHQIRIFNNVNVEKQKVGERIFNDISTKFFRKLNGSSFFVEKLVISMVTNWAVKAFVRIVQKVLHSSQVFLDSGEQLSNFKGNYSIG